MACWHQDEQADDAVMRTWALRRWTGHTLPSKPYELSFWIMGFARRIGMWSIAPCRCCAYRLRTFSAHGRNCPTATDNLRFRRALSSGYGFVGQSRAEHTTNTLNPNWNLP